VGAAAGFGALAGAAAGALVGAAGVVAGPHAARIDTLAAARPARRSSTRRVHSCVCVVLGSAFTSKPPHCLAQAAPERAS
jgi:hypothetical protein